MYDLSASGSFAFGPFEETKASVYMMALGIIESGFVNSMLEDPAKVEFLCQYLLSDPNLNHKMKDINQQEQAGFQSIPACYENNF